MPSKVVEPKDVYSLTVEENENIMDASVMTHFHTPPPPLKSVVFEDTMIFFMNIAKAKQMEVASSKPPIDYECISKKQARSKLGPIV